MHSEQWIAIAAVFVSGVAALGGLIGWLHKLNIAGRALLRADIAALRAENSTAHKAQLDEYRGLAAQVADFQLSVATDYVRKDELVPLRSDIRDLNATMTRMLERGADGGSTPHRR